MSARRVNRQPAQAPVQSDEAALFAEVLTGSDEAWRRFVKKYDSVLQGAVRESTDAIHPLTPAELDDVMGDFWLRMVENDRRWLRRFRGGGASLDAFLRMHALDIAHEHVRRLENEPETVSLAHARHVPAPPKAPVASNVPHDLAALGSLLQLPGDVQALRADVNNLRAAVEQLRRALPPALLSVKEAAKAINVSTVTIRRMIRAGTLAHTRVGRSLRVDLTRTPVRSFNREDGKRALVNTMFR